MLIKEGNDFSTVALAPKLFGMAQVPLISEDWSLCDKVTQLVAVLELEFHGHVVLLNFIQLSSPVGQFFPNC